MRMKTFQADSMQEALLQIKEELGPEAVILRTRKSLKKALGKKKEIFEVTAALEDGLYARPDDINSPLPGSGGTYNRSKFKQANKSESAGKINEGLDLSKDELSRTMQKVNIPVLELKGLQGEVKILSRQINQLHHAVGNMNPDRIAPDFLDLFYELLEIDIEDNLARELSGNLERIIPVSKRGDKDHVRKVLARIISNRMRASEETRIKPGRTNVIMMVGPTGMGKTTTIAKLCGIYTFEKGMRVGVLSTDLYKIGAREQVEQYCRSMEIPVEHVYSKEDVAPALKNLSGCDIIFVDTSGRAQNYPEHWQNLKDLVAEAQPDEIHLVLNCTTRTRELLYICDRFAQIGASRMIFTKLDEAMTLGCIYNLIAARNLPVSYLCNGQDVPDNILRAEKNSLTSILMDGISELAVEHL